MEQQSVTLSRWARRIGLASITAVSLAVIAACGGGGSDAGGTAATGTAFGKIEGFGSIIVNGVRYEDSAATVVNDDDEASSTSELKLGMVVEVKSDGVSNGTGTARHIGFGSGLVGPVDAVDATAGTLTVLGQSVTVSSTTVFDGITAGGLSAITAGTVVNIHGIFDPNTGVTAATRIEVKNFVPAYRLRGVVSDLDTTAKTLKIGGQSVSYAAVERVPVNLANGFVVRARLAKVQVAGVWIAERLKAAYPQLENRDNAEIEGFVTAFTSATAFSVNGIPVDASAATVEGDVALLVLGARVEVEGAVVDGVLKATKVEIKTERRDRERGFELHGLVSGLNTTAKTFSLRGLTVDYSGSVTFKDGTEAQLVDGARVEVKGALNADRTAIVATSIEFESR